ncbi:MAG: HEAT repeat domain-containing protein [Planctomycetota bacterium]|nr:HEAT repeat domain-containing protein [Planctomycetota bacterium]
MVEVPPGTTRELALQILLDSMRSEWPQMRANALEALIPDPKRLRGEVVAGFLDENRGVRFVALMAMYEAGLCELQPMARELLEDPSDSVRAAAILALRRCGATIDPTPLAVMATSDDPEVRANAFMVLGLLGNPSADQLIRDALGHSMGLVNPNRARIVELQGATALVRLGDAGEIQPIRAALFTPSEQGELVLLAIQSLSELRDEGAKGMLVRLVEAEGEQSRRPPEIRLAAATALARLSYQGAGPYLRLALEFRTDPDPAIRAQVAAMLGYVPSERGEVLLTDLLEDPSGAVRLAAAGSVLRLSAGGLGGASVEAAAMVGGP